MRKVKTTIEDIINEVTNMKGKNIKMHVNKGRKRIEKYTGIIESIYPSVFTVSLNNCSTLSKFSCSYSDVLCGDVKIFKE